MKVIFTQNVRKVGQKGEVKDVNEGYARNFLIPGKFAIEATTSALADLKNKKDAKDSVTKRHSKEFEETLAKLADFTLAMKKKANAEGHLFSGVTLKEILANLKALGIHLEEKNFDLRTPIKKTGEISLPIIGAEGHNLKISIEAEK